ncbi:helix-turn-helix transcriptional regulator [Fibrivirga algicola]|uniref:Helix-turn-helix transcriptional regulator n=1 Tax=Fibrivirga algicola TaxID=2950420 RepID=A0ABX0QQI9_9BACT|nr:helix-turn-helix transcriptional regulator [Fibrivirga algicola]NID12434.1 helix-turn-helix transcriptional regulator [Fibrivirga algicola]
MSINDKIKQVLTIKNLSPSYLADDIGVQRSSISHILSGRNRPSLDIIQKIVRRFPEFTYEWFLEEDGQLSTDEPPAQALSTTRTQRDSTSNTRQLPHKSFQPASSDPAPGIVDQINSYNETVIPKQEISAKQIIDRILIFYTDGTFREYMPAS